MSKKKIVILGQDKNYKGKIPTKVVNEAITKLKKRTQEHFDDNTIIGGFEINGGEGLTKTGYQAIEEFDSWAIKNNMRAVYNSKSDMEQMKENLRIKVKFI